MPVGGRDGRAKGYKTAHERAMKRQRRDRLAAGLAQAQRRLGEGRPSVVRGGRRLAHQRHHLVEADLTVEQWRERWDADRLFLSAAGDAEKPHRYGNQLITVHPDQGWVQIALPRPLAHLSNTPGRAATYRLEATVRFVHRADEWAAQTCSGSVAYDITHDAGKGRWYVDASWTTTPWVPPTLKSLRTPRTVGVDLNDGHLACWVLGADAHPHRAVGHHHRGHDR